VAGAVVQRAGGWRVRCQESALDGRECTIRPAAMRFGTLFAVCIAGIVSSCAHSPSAREPSAAVTLPSAASEPAPAELPKPEGEGEGEGERDPYPECSDKYADTVAEVCERVQDDCESWDPGCDPQVVKEHAQQACEKRALLEMKVCVCDRRDAPKDGYCNDPPAETLQPDD